MNETSMNAEAELNADPEYQEWLNQRIQETKEILETVENDNPVE